jgi:hypothetical protein
MDLSPRSERNTCKSAPFTISRSGGESAIGTKAVLFLRPECPSSLRPPVRARSGVATATSAVLKKFRCAAPHASQEPHRGRHVHGASQVRQRPGGQRLGELGVWGRLQAAIVQTCSRSSDSHHGRRMPGGTTNSSQTAS